MHLQYYLRFHKYLCMLKQVSTYCTVIFNSCNCYNSRIMIFELRKIFTLTQEQTILSGDKSALAISMVRICPGQCSVGDFSPGRSSAHENVLGELNPKCGEAGRRRCLQKRPRVRALCETIRAILLGLRTPFAARRSSAPAS